MNAAMGRGAILVGAAVLLGLVLLAFGLDDGDSDNAITAPPAPTDTSDTSVLDSQETIPPTTAAGNGSVPVTAAPSTTPPGVDVAHSPNEVLVMTANGSGTPGEAGRLATALGASNFQTDAADALATSTSKIYFRSTYAADAQAVAELLGAPADIIAPMPETPPVVEGNDTPARAADAHIIVIIGSDLVFP
ncbi:MAG: LytR C-terminal domain-containing protein [Acidimicrobiales bacterium]|nr:LytR C-terminal domain-containing protein [Acidimicrobiales bacterium]